MSSAVITHAQGITQPLEGLHGHFSDLAAKHRDANDQLRSHANDLLSSGSSDHFTGAGASAFSGLVNYYVDTSEKHMQALDSATNAVHTCHSSVTDATNTASSADLHDGLTHKVLTKVSHDDIIQHGESSIQAVINDMLATLNDMKNTAGDFFHNVFTGHFGDAVGDLGTEFKDASHLVDDVTSLLQDIGRVLGQWASAICDAVGKCLKVVGSVLWNVLDFVTGIPSMINDVKTLFDPKASRQDKLNAALDLTFNVVADCSMLVGGGEALRGGKLAVKGLEEGGEKLLEDSAEKGITEFFQKGLGDAEERSGVTQFGQDLLQQIKDKGVEINDDPETQRYMASREDAGGCTWFNGSSPEDTTVLLGPNVNDAAIYEEYQHVLNGEARGWVGLDVQGAYEEEVRVETHVLSRADDLGMTQAERKKLQQNIDGYRKLLYDEFGITLP